MTPRGYRPRRSESGLLWVAERIPPPSLWLPPSPVQASYYADFTPPELIRARGLLDFVFTIGPVTLTPEAYDVFVYDQAARTTSIFQVDSDMPHAGMIGRALHDAAAGEELAVDLDGLASMGDTLQEILDLPETPA